MLVQHLLRRLRCFCRSPRGLTSFEFSSAPEWGGAKSTFRTEKHGWCRNVATNKQTSLSSTQCGSAAWLRLKEKKGMISTQLWAAGWWRCSSSAMKERTSSRIGKCVLGPSATSSGITLFNCYPSSCPRRRRLKILIESRSNMWLWGGLRCNHFVDVWDIRRKGVFNTYF